MIEKMLKKIKMLTNWFTIKFNNINKWNGYLNIHIPLLLSKNLSKAP